MLYENNIILDAFVIFFTFTFLFISFLYAAGLFSLHTSKKERLFLRCNEYKREKNKMSFLNDHFYH